MASLEQLLQQQPQVVQPSVSASASVATSSPRDPDVLGSPHSEGSSSRSSQRRSHRKAPAGADTDEDTPVGSIPVPASNMAGYRRDFFARGRLSGSSSEEDTDSDNPTGNMPVQSTSYFKPRTLDGYSKYFEPLTMEGYLEKQSSENHNMWKRRWFVMQESKLFYYKSAKDVQDKKPTDSTCCGVIQLDNVDSVTTAKDYGVGAFQIRLESRRYVLRAESKDLMQDWLFNFQRSIANIVSVLLRSQADHRPNRLTSSYSRRQSMSRANRSISFDCQDYVEHYGVSALDEFYQNRGSAGAFGFGETGSFSDGSSNGDNYYHRTSPRRASSPVAMGNFGPRSPLGMMTMFQFDPLDSGGHEEFLEPRAYFEPHGQPLVEVKESDGDDDDDEIAARGGTTLSSLAEMADSPALAATMSPPVATGKYIPRFLRNRQAATAAMPPPPEDPLPAPSPTASPPPAPVGRWVPRHQREGYTARTSIESFSFTARDSLGNRESFGARESLTESFLFDDNHSYCSGDESHGVTSLLGVRTSMEDVCCCIPDLNAHISSDYCQKQSIYAVFDGHCGVRAATFSNQRLVSYLSAHECFHSDPRVAFEDCFRRIDAEFLEKATAENLSDGTTAAVVLIRGNRLLTANVGDSRAVVSVGGVALDVIEEQTPGRKDERARIERQGGWVKEERELQMSKLHSMDLSDPEIKKKAERVVRWVNVYRVNGELAVSRAIGDIDYKGEKLSQYEYWAFPEGHDRQFHGDLIIPDPEFKEIEITPEVAFLIVACDGLWDTITSQEAVDYVAERLREGLSTKQVSHSLASFAIRSGSSDNVSVVVVLLQPHPTRS